MPSFEAEFEFIEYFSSKYFEMLALRQQVLREPLGLKFTTTALAQEAHHLFLICKLEGKLVGCCTLELLKEQRAKIRQVAIDPLAQGKSLGKHLMLKAESFLLEKKHPIIFLNARKNVIDFYLRLGYVLCSEEFEEIGLPHFTMTKNLLVQ